MARSLRLLLFRGPGELGKVKAAFVSRSWSLLINSLEADASRAWPSLETVWKKRRVDSFILDPFAENSNTACSISGDDWKAELLADERRPGRPSLLLQTPQVSIGVDPTSQQETEPVGNQRVLILDASWTHIPRFPEREEVRGAFESSFAESGGRIHYITSLPWDAQLFEQVVADLGQAHRADMSVVQDTGDILLAQAREILPRIDKSDTILLGLVPGRDDRGAFQRLRSDFAERTPHVRAYPGSPLSTGPGASREEALATLGLWLPARVFIAGGPISEQFLLARHLKESTGGSEVEVGVSGGEYRLPSLDLIHHYDTGQPVHHGVTMRQRASRAGLIVVTDSPDDSVTLVGIGLPQEVLDILPKIRLNRRGKTPKQVVREVEAAFSSRGIPVPAARYLP